MTATNETTINIDQPTLTLDLIDAPPAPVSEETRLLELIDRYTTVKADAAAASREALRQAADIDNRRKTLDHRLHEAEQRMNILAGSAAKYRDSQRAQAIGRLLQGDTSVDLEAVQEADPMDKLSANDLKLGIAELRNQRTELGREWDFVRSRVAKLEREFYRAHCVIHVAKFQLARDQVHASWVEIMGAESAAAKFAIHSGMDVLVNSQALTSLVLPSADGSDAMADVRRPGIRFGAAEVSGERILATHIIRNQAAALSAEFKNGGV